jgi:hypothetical protein
MRSDSLAEHLRRLQRGTSRGDRRAAVPLDGEERRGQTEERYDNIDEKRYEANPFRARTRLTTAWFPSREDEKPQDTPLTLTTHADVD